MEYKENEHCCKILIENQLYAYVSEIERIYKGEKAERLIKKYIEDFKEIVMKKYPVENIDELIENTLKKVKEYEERNSR